MIGIAFAGLANNRNREATTRAEQAIRLENVAKEAQDHVKEDSEEWKLAEGEGGDGGSAVGLPRRNEGAEQKQLGVFAAKDEKTVAKEKVEREKMRVELGAAGSSLGSAGDRAVGGNNSYSSPKSKPAVATCAPPPSHTQQESEHPEPNTELSTQFTQRMAYLDLDDDDEGGVSIVYR